jgi:hypothetical protein
MVLTPKIEGTVPIRSSAAAFLEAFRRRVDAGLLTGRPHRRANYRVVDAAGDRLVVVAADWLTALNVGLNHVELTADRGAIRYRVQYWRWAAYGIALCGTLGLIGVAMLVGLDARGYIARNPGSMIPGLSIDQNLWIAWLMVVFGGLGWPWLLIALHRRPLAGLVKRLVAEVDASASPS